MPLPLVRSIRNWNNWTIRRQVYAGMGLVVGLLLLIATVSVLSTARIAAVFDGYRETARHFMAGTAVAANVSEAELAALAYRTSGLETHRDAVDASIQNMMENERQLRTLLEGDEEALALLADNDEHIGEYQAHFEATIELQGQYDVSVERIDEIGPALRKTLSEVAVSARNSGDAETGFVARAVQEAVLLAAFGIEGFLASQETVRYDETLEHLNTALERGKNLESSLRNAGLKEMMGEVTTGIQGFLAEVETVHAIVEERSTHYAEMDLIGPHVIADIDALLDQVAARQNTLGANGSAVIKQVTLFTQGLGVLSLVIAGFLAYRIGRMLSDNVNRSVVTMTELARDNLEVEIEGQDRQNELGEMARALVVFRDNALEARALAEEKAAADARERALEAEQVEREKLAAQDAKRQADLERQRLEEMEQFQVDFDAVIATAVDGNFAVRLTSDTNMDGLVKLGDSFNLLLENVEGGLAETGRIIKSMASGDLTVRMAGSYNGAFAQLQTDVNTTLEAMSNLVGELSERGQSVTGKSTELQSAAFEMSRRSEQNAASLEETSAALEEMSSSVRQVAGNVKQANSDAQTASEAARSGAAVSEESVTALSEINDASKRMESIAGIIEDIAFQINLLALNAGVESARAGEAGRGFAVVAQEVRSLAQRSTEAVSDISAVIATARDKVTAGVANVGRTQETLNRIVNAVEQVSEQMANVAVSMDQQSTGIGEINIAVNTLDASTQANAAASEEVSAASSVLQEDAGRLNDALSAFKTQKGGAETSWKNRAA